VTKPESSVINVRDMNTMITGAPPGEKCSKCEEYKHFDY